MKRPLDAPTLATSPSKRARTATAAPLKAHYRQPGDLLLPANPQDPAVLDSLVDRSLAITLHAAGFDAVKRDAFESLRDAVDSYLTRLAHLTQLAMTASRRTKVQPQDIQYALRYSNIPLNTLLPELLEPAAQKGPPKPSTIYRTTQPPLFPRAPTSSTTTHFAFPGSSELSRELGGVSDKESRKWIPRHFPAFPPPHTYKSTAAPLSEREMDARKVRERATEEGVLAERALRKLVGARKKMESRASGQPGTSASGITGALKDGGGTGAGRKRLGDEDVFKEAMDAVLVEDKETGRESLQHEDEVLFFDASKEDPPPPEDADGEDMAFGAVVNWDRAHWRSGARDVLAMSQ